MSDEIGLMPNGHRWSSSAIDTYLRCPLAWDMRYGNRRLRMREMGAQSPDDEPGDVARRRGRVLHAGLAEALIHARIELRRVGAPIPGKLRRYYGPARRALGRAWVEEGMPSDSGEAGRVMDMFDAALDAVDIPLPGALHGVEERYEDHVTAGGVPVVFVPDVTLWVVRGRVLRVTDWKSGKVAEEDVPRHQQLLRYAGWLMQREPGIESCEIELYALREGRGYVVKADPELVDRAVKRFDRIAREAAADPDPAPKTGPHCVGCWFVNVCPAVNPTAGEEEAA